MVLSGPMVAERLGWALALGWFGALVACGGGLPAAFPGRADIAKAEVGWCDMLVKTKLAGAESMTDCKAAIPTASAGFLKGMTKCFKTRMESFGDSAPDKGLLFAECKEETYFNLPADDAGTKNVIEARCERMLKCEKVPVDECKASVGKLEQAQRVVFTNTYNTAALEQIADCLSSTSCSSNEDTAREHCYAPWTEKLVWFP
jgi:hypothetical protein